MENPLQKDKQTRSDYRTSTANFMILFAGKILYCSFDNLISVFEAVSMSNSPPANETAPTDQLSIFEVDVRSIVHSLKKKGLAKG